MAAPSPKKRKASALDDDTKPIKNGHRSSTDSHKIRKEQSEDIFDDVSETKEIPFIIECPARSNKRKSKGKDDVFGPQIEDGGFKPLAVSYAIRPGSAWSNMKTYRNFIGKRSASPSVPRC